MLLTALLIIASFFGSAATLSPRVKSNDLQRLTGHQWIGTLTYTDYRSGKPVSIRSNLTVTRSNADKLSWVFEYQYPDEPKANSKSTVTISKDGSTLDDETVVERFQLPGKVLRIVTEKSGTDNDRRATFRYTYELKPTTFSILKEVCYEGETAFFKRNQYSWERN